MRSEMAVLAPPMSGSSLEVSFRRLLKSCEEIAAGDAKGREDLEHWHSSPAFHANVDMLQELAADLTTLPDSRLDPQIKDVYQKRVSQITSKLRPVALPDYGPSKLPEAAELAATVDRPRTPRLSQASRPSKSPLRPSSHPNASALDSKPAELRQRTNTTLNKPMQQETKDALDRHKNLQEDLTDEMVALAAGLKRNAQAMKQAVERREGILDDTEQAVEDSLVNAKRSTKDAQKLKVKGSITFCMILLSMLVVSLVFVGTYMFIKTTSFLGYKVRPR